MRIPIFFPILGWEFLFFFPIFGHCRSYFPIFSLSLDALVLCPFSVPSKFLSLLAMFNGRLFCSFLQTGFVCLGILGLVAVSNPVTFVMVVPVTIGFVYLRNYFMKSSREIKRIEGISKETLWLLFSLFVRQTKSRRVASFIDHSQVHFSKNWLSKAIGHILFFFFGINAIFVVIVTLPEETP